MPSVKKTFILYMALSAGASALSVGDTYQQVTAEKGEPRSRMVAGNLQILNYPDFSIKLRDNTVVAVTPSGPANRTETLPKPSPPQTPAQRLAATSRELQEAIARVQFIINQPPPMGMRTPQMRVWEYSNWFDAGSLKPDFGKVDVRKTQETPYDAEDFVCLKSRPELVWAGHDLEFNPMLKFFYVDRSVPKKKLTNDEMAEINLLYRSIGRLEKELNKSGIALKPSS